MNAQELLKAGYKRCQDHEGKHDWHGHQYFFQKKIYHQDGKLLYFINVYQYDWRGLHRQSIDYSYEAKLWLYMDDKTECLHIEFNCDKFNVEELQEFVNKLYTNIGCVPDKHND